MTMKDLAGYFGYLDNLWASGATNMYGARPYLQEDCDLDKATASKVLSAWMRTYNGDKTPEQRAELAGAL